METREDQQRETNAGDDAPSEHAEKPKLQFLRHPGLDDKGIKSPQHCIAEQQEGNYLPCWLGQNLIPRQTGASNTLAN